MAVPAMAAEDSLIGLSQDRLVACAGLPAGTMQAGPTLYFQYETSRSVGSASVIGGTLFMNQHNTGCSATVGLRDGRIVSVARRPYGGLLTGPLACGRLFASCQK